MKKFLNVLFSICISIVIIVGVINFTVGFKQLYYFDIDYLNISELSGLSKDDIKLNYDYLIDYNLNKNVSEFKLPTLKSSPQGKIHFEEVRNIFQNINKLAKVLLVVSLVGIILSVKNKNIKILKTTSITLIIMPLLLTVPILLNFEKSFIIFHKLLFRNDYWIFNPDLDPVINILPEEFFFHSGMMILILILLVSILLFVMYKLCKSLSIKIFQC
ncbi:TPA: TIGR01906 family membrane protein [Clostridioides difficile]|uniref:TIGR01906 family membrane protein n=1 Tax=Clostridioides difficile TaxID=1496 RepID=UPI0009769524|nr:TIGR01906 family membrane protein [Clostridioides difficile]EGT3782199.1 TIGR01906 family membrane protein [Clostridioides difficile]EGT5071424.1 TIGR01906 family membrane protein [Clostridioides difficile]EKS6836393.1 TIGR01906 family membrane protein [Clostridioides difficile]ELX4516589.1 TIGR01906 family membrane protein [Clostridioides difficile]MCO5819938.1 TIGR01906 family membrane protein [Clostridioides difficile]